MTPAEREHELDRRLGALGSVAVAFSGGVDSAYLAVRAHRVLGDRALAVTAVSPSLAEAQRAQAAEVAARFGLAHLFVETSEVDDPRYAANDGQRCYWCKTELFQRLLPIARERGLAHLAYGLIRDDLADFRPGHRAAAEAGVVSPLADAGLGKEDVRALSRAMGLPTWDLPASPCLSSRVPYGTVVTRSVLRQVERAEENVRALGFREFRVRHLGDVGRVEVAPAELVRLQDAAVAEAVGAAVRAAGYRDALVDQEGYRRGRLNDALSQDGVGYDGGSWRSQMFGLGVGEIVLILVILVVLFGASRIPELGKGIGEGIRNFKKGMKGGDEDEKKS